MPEPITGKLTPDEYIRAKAYLNSIWKNWQCPVSLDLNWELADTVGAVPNFGGPLWPTVYPYLIVMCTGCGYTVFVNAVKAGIVPPAPTLPPQPQAPLPPPGT